MTGHVEPDPRAALVLMLDRLQHEGPADYANAREGGLVELLLIIGAERYGGPDELAKALQFFLAALDVADLAADDGHS